MATDYLRKRDDHSKLERSQVLDIFRALRPASPNSKGKVADSFCLVMLYAVALHSSVPLFLSHSLPPGFDAVMHLSKVRIFSECFPSVPRWFPWWYCGTPSLRFYPPLSYLAAASASWLFQISALEAYEYTDLLAFYLAGLFMYHFMRMMGNSRLSSLASAMLYMLSPQTLFGRFFTGHYAHNFSMFLIPLILFLISRYGDDARKAALVTAPVFALVFLSHLQTALSLGLMLGTYLIFSLLFRSWADEPGRIRPRLQGLIFGGALGISLASIWLIPCLSEGMQSLWLSAEAARNTMIPVESLFVYADWLWYLEPLPRLWARQYYLGLPALSLALAAVALITSGRLTPNKMFWGVVSGSWVAVLLFGIVSPYVGLVLGLPMRLPFFVSIPIAMLDGLTIDWIQVRLSPSSRREPRRKITSFIFAAIALLSPFVHSSNMSQFVYHPYSNETEAAKLVDSLNAPPYERVGAFGTFSYVFNVFSDRWQLDGGYAQGQVNSDFYYKYWQILTTSEDVDTVLEALNETNTRYVVQAAGQKISSAFQNRTHFRHIRTAGFDIFKLNDSYRLDFVTVTGGEATVTFTYPHPDRLHLSIRDCSPNTILILKMNYYPGWVAYPPSGNANLTRDLNGLMRIGVSGDNDLDIELQYVQTWVDYAGLIMSISAAAVYLLLLSNVLPSILDGCDMKRRKGAVTEYLHQEKGLH